MSRYIVRIILSVSVSESGLDNKADVISKAESMRIEIVF